MNRVSPETLSRLFREHSAALTLYARQWSESPEDVVQEAFLSLAKLRDPPESFTGWLYRAVRNAAIDASRSSHRRRRRESIASAGESWFQKTEDGLDARIASEALAQLDRDLGEVIIARIWGGLTFEEIATLAATPLSTVYRRYRAGLEQLRERLEGRWITSTKTFPTT